MNHCIRRGDYRLTSLQAKKEVLLLVSCKIGVICSVWSSFFFSSKRISRDTPERQRDIWLHGSLAPTSSDTQAYTYVTLPMAFRVTRWIIHAPGAEGIHHYLYCCFKALLFMSSLISRYLYICVYKQKLACRQWISSLTNARASARAAFVFCQCLH